MVLLAHVHIPVEATAAVVRERKLIAGGRIQREVGELGGKDILASPGYGTRL